MKILDEGPLEKAREGPEMFSDGEKLEDNLWGHQW